MKRLFIIRSIIVFILIIVFVACNSSNKLELSGILERKIIEVSAPVSEIITDIPLKVGDFVDKDTIIVQLNTDVAILDLNASEAALSAAKALLKESTGVFNRQKKLLSFKVTSTQAYDIAKRKKDEAIAQVAEKEARIAQAKKRLSDLTIRTRVAGILDQLPYETGERSPSGGVVAVIITNDKPWVRTWVPARSVKNIKLGHKVFIKVSGYNNIFNGIVEYISREPEFTPHYALTERESAHLVYEAKIRLSNSKNEIPPGLPAWVTIPIDKK